MVYGNYIASTCVGEVYIVANATRNVRARIYFLTVQRAQGQRSHTLQYAALHSYRSGCLLIAFLTVLWSCDRWSRVILPFLFISRRTYLKHFVGGMIRVLPRQAAYNNTTEWRRKGREKIEKDENMFCLGTRSVNQPRFARSPPPIR